MALDEELGRDDAELLGHVLADPHQRLTTLPTGAGFGLVQVLDTRQLLGQGLTAGAFAFRFLGGREMGPHLGRLALFVQAGFAGSEVGGQGFVEEVPCGGGQGLALDAEFHPPQIGQFEGQLLDLGIAPANLRGVGLDLFEQPTDPVLGPEQQFRRG